MAVFKNLDKYKKERTVQYRNSILEKYLTNGEIILPKILRPGEELLLRHNVEIDALYASYIRNLALKGNKKEVVLKVVEKIFEDLVVPKFGVTGYELASDKRKFEYGEISEALRSRVKDEYGVDAIPFAQEYMDMVIESVANADYKKGKTMEVGAAFSPISAIRPIAGLPA